MPGVRRRTVLFVVGGLLLSGAWSLRLVAARAEAELGVGAAESPRPAGERAFVAPIALAGPEGADFAVVPRAAKPALMHVSEGDYVPFYKPKAGPQTVRVPAFRIAPYPVTNQEFLGFVMRDPRWRRSRVQRLFAEASYLAAWSADLELGAGSARAAVTGVSWFAAKAYCKSVGARLPSTIEWERARSVVGASFSDSSRLEIPESLRAIPAGQAVVTNDARANPAASLWEWTLDFNSVPLGSGGPDDSVASLFCGAGARASDASDYSAFLRYSFRSSLKADFTLKNLGFRCAESET